MATREETLANIERLSDRHERLIAEGFLTAVRNIRSLASLEAIETALRDGGSQAVQSLFGREALRNAQGAMESAITNAAFAGAAQFAADQPAVRNFAGDLIEFSFNVGNPRVATFANETAARRVVEISESLRRNIRRIVVEDASAGINPLDSARRIRDGLGLTERQDQAVQNYRRMLRTVHRRRAEGLVDRLDAERSLRDRRSDRTLLAAARNGRPLDEDQVESMTRRYRSRFIDYRARTIGRTEAIRSLSGGARAYMEQMVEEGRVDEKQVRRFWHYTRDGNARHSHIEIPRRHGAAGVGLNEPFDSPLGLIMFPGDGAAEAANVVNCRCAVFQRVVDAELLDIGAVA